MMTMDCHNRRSCLGSMSVIYDVPMTEIEEFLRDVDLDEHYKRTHPRALGDSEITRLFEQQFGRVSTPLERVYWFHLTRAAEGADFRDGILPLGQALDRVWETVLTVFRDPPEHNNLRLLRERGVPDWHYGTKVGQPLLGGPYAMLVRESAFRAREMGNHDYLWLPEIMEDICNGYREAYGHVIHERLCNALTPFIVKFWSTKMLGKNCVESAMYYLYSTAHEEELCDLANTCYDGANSRVPPERIVCVGVPRPVYDD